MIRKSVSVILGIILLLFSPLSKGIESTVTCSHPKVCQTVETLAPDLNVKMGSSLQNLESDPHHGQLTLGQMKELIRAKILVTPSSDLQHWLSKVLKNRKSSTTFSFEIKKKSLSPADKRILAHFWLYPRQLCDNLPKIESFLQAHFPNSEIQGKQQLFKTCQKLIKKIDTVLGSFTKSKDAPLLILTHDALSLMFEKYNIETLALSGSAHGESFGTRELKKLKTLIKKSPETPLIWVLEEGLHTTSKVKRMTRDIDKVVTINTSGYGQKGRDIFAPLNKLMDFLREFNDRGENE